MEQLQRELRRVLADTFVMYFKAHAFHWNVEGMFFSQYHEFFGGLYEELHGAIDPTAEEIRKLGFYAPMSLDEMYADKTTGDDIILAATSPTAKIVEMLGVLDSLNSRVINSLNSAFATANTANEQGLADYLAGRLSTHKKHQWMIRSSMKSS